MKITEQCDEGRPVCRRCLIGSHECVFPGFEPKHPRDTTDEAPKPRRQALQETALDDNSDSDDSICVSSTATSAGSPFLGLVRSRTYDPIAARFQAAFVNTAPWLSTFDIPITPDLSPKLSYLPLFRTPRPIHDDLIPFFLSYHRQNINYGRYFWYSDPQRFIKEGLLDLAKESESLQYAIAAFSALIYSIQRDQRMKKFTFLFYAKAIQELQQVINNNSIDSEASLYTTVATILELASIEVLASPV